MDPLFNLQDKIAVVTGGMGQLGMAYNLALVERGVTVISLDVADSPKLPTTGYDLAVQNKRLISMKCNIAKKTEVQSVSDKIVDQVGVPHILINNAALDSPPDASADEVGPFENYPESSYDRVMEVNVKGTFVCCQVFGGRMAEHGRGSIINVSSTYGILSPCQDIYDFRRRNGEVFFKPVAYSISKSAILNLTRYLATYWAQKGVRVNTLTPAGIANNQPEEFLEAYCSRVPMGRMAEMDEMVGAVVYLASDASSYVTGSNIVVDGGWSAW